MYKFYFCKASNRQKITLFITVNNYDICKDLHYG